MGERDQRDAHDRLPGGAKPTALVLDFDGTLTTRDVGNAICDRFAPPAWLAIDEQWLRGELPLPQAQRLMWGLVECSRAQAVSYAAQVGELRPGLDALLQAADDRGCRLTLASGGFDFYIEPLLGARLARFHDVFYNRAHFHDRRIELEFPHRDLGCSSCAICKGRVCDRVRAVLADAHVIFVGDGSSDCCALGHADQICAVRGSQLAQACASAGIAAVEFERLDELVPLVGG